MSYQKNSKKQKIIIVFLSILFGLLLCEIISKIFVKDITTVAHVDFQLHKNYGWTHKKDTSRYSISTSDKPVRIEYNKKGYRDVDHIISKPPQTKRVAIIGDSFTAAIQVDIDNTFAKKLQNYINDKSFYRWEILNFGVAAYGTFQEFLTLKNEFINYNPDIIILQTFPFNDICDNTIKAALLGGPQDYYRPYPSESVDDNKITYINNYFTFLRNNSYLFKVNEWHAINSLQKIKKLPKIDTNQYKKYIATKLINSDSTYMISDFTDKDITDSVNYNIFSTHEEQLDVIKDGWLKTENYIRKISEFCNNNNLPLILLSIPYDSQINPFYKNHTNRFPFTYDRYYAENRLERLAKNNGVIFVKLIEEFDNNSSQVLPFVDGHLNEFANDLVAKILLDKVSIFIGKDKYYTQKIFFNSESKNNDILMSGFGKPENTHTWTTDNISKLSINKKEKIYSEKNYKLQISCIPFAPKQIGQNQFFDLYINDNLIRKITLPQDNSSIFIIETIVTGEILNIYDQHLELKFVFNDRKSPKELGISPDHRLLGIALVSLSINSAL